MTLSTRSYWPITCRRVMKLAARACNKGGSSSESGCTYTRFRIITLRSFKYPSIGCRSGL